MGVLDYTLKMLTFCGCWRPNSWSTRCQKFVYNGFTVFVLLLIHTFTISQLMDLVLNTETVDDFNDTFYVLLAMFISCCKMYSLLMNRGNIEVLTSILETEPCAPETAEENAIQMRFNKMISSNTFHYVAFIETSVCCISLVLLIPDIKNQRLAYKAWLPYDYSSSTFLYVLSYTHQLLGLTFGSLLHVASDSLICGFLVQTCCQIEVLECRLKNIGTGQKSAVKNCARHHYQIYGFAKLVNEDFKIIILIQFLVSTLVVCCSLYQLAKMTGLDSQCVQIIMYMMCMLTQIFFLCWYGNELKFKSLEVINTIFGMNWISLDTDCKKILLFIMQRATVPIEFTSAYMVSMNLNSFVSILKTSYSAYNMLQQAK